MTYFRFIGLLLVMTFSLTSFAQYVGSGSNTSATTTATASQRMLNTVSTAKNMANNARVSLQGNIVQQYNKTYFQFEDDTGNMNITIATNITWPGQINENDLVRIIGRIEKKRNAVTEVRVDRIERISVKTPIPR